MSALPAAATSQDTSTVGHIQHQQVNRERDDHARQRAATVYRLWLRGYSLSRIAHEVGYANQSSARKALLRAKRDIATPPDLEEERHRERERLEIAYAGIAERVEEGDVCAIDRAIAIAARKAALLGLDVSKGEASAATHYSKVVVIEAAADTIAAIRGPASNSASNSALDSGPAPDVSLIFPGQAQG